MSRSLASPRLFDSAKEGRHCWVSRKDIKSARSLIKTLTPANDWHGDEPVYAWLQG